MSQGTLMAGSFIRRTFNVPILQRNWSPQNLVELAKITHQVNGEIRLHRLTSQLLITPQAKFSTTLLKYFHSFYIHLQQLCEG